MIIVTATYASTVQALAEANGPYVVDAALQLTFTGSPDEPDTTYLWDFGDGSTATGRIATHAYAEHGIYVAKLTTTVNESGGVVTREFAKVRVRNVPPTVDAGPPLFVDEGTALDVVATFTDPEWPDTHRALFNWGDDSPPTAGTVTETNVPPRSTGTARATHTWCHSGTFTVTVEVEDEDGGIGSDQVDIVVRNVPPRVDAGPDLFAYRCTPLNLVARFTDPGWCDTHVGYWDFGDCTPIQPATVREIHEPPADVGVVIATHRYDTCGEFLATCLVIDDDGGQGRDALVVRVVDVRNRDMEGGFRHLVDGIVANDWEPYVGPPPAADPYAQPQSAPPRPGTVVFAPDEFVVHSGQRAQRISADGGFSSGLWQHVGTNERWEYQLTCWFHIDELTQGATARLGVDPSGGTDPTAATVSWSEGNTRHQWQQLCTRVAATAHQLTIFLEARSDAATSVWFDDVALTPFPCPAPRPERTKPKPPVATCVDWRAEKEARKLPSPYDDSGFTFEAAGGGDLLVVTWGSPPDEGKLAIPARGLDIRLPSLADEVDATIAVHSHDAVAMTAWSADGSSLGSATSTAQTGNMELLTVAASGISRVVLTGGSNEALLIALCAYSRSRRGPDQGDISHSIIPRRSRSHG